MVTEPLAIGGSAGPRQRATVTLKEVAAQAGVSLGVASTVLSGGSNNIRVALKTHSRVLEAAQALGYRSRRSSSHSPVQNRSSSTDGTVGFLQTRPLTSITIGVIASFNPDSTPDSIGANYDPWEQDITAGFEIALSDAAANVVTHYCNRGRRGHLPLPIGEAIEQMTSIGVDALALIEISSSPHEVGRCIPLLAATGRPFVVVSTDALTAPAANVFFDSVNAGYQAAQHLIEQGYTNICFLAPVSAPWADERIEGAREALMNAGLSPDNLRVYPPEAERLPLPSFDARVSRWDHVASGLEAGKRLLAQDGIPPQAIIAANDATAVGFEEAAEHYGFRFGVDYGLIGFDDSPRARQLGLTTVRPPREGMGREAARLLMRIVAGDESGRQQVRLNSHLMARRSTPPRITLSNISVSDTSR